MTIFLTLAVASCKDNGQDQSREKTNSGNVFTTLDYDKVVAYNYDGEGDIEIIDNKGHLAKKIKKQILLNRAQTTKLTNIFCAKSTYGGDVAACFDPHFGIVFYKANKAKVYVSVCLDCNYLISSIRIPNSGATGFSDNGAKQIFEFKKKINF